ncbi:MAG: 3-hydroxyacyl-ACP dehydratase [Candidatus Eisenbacteria bacterium]|nr:3-hydroxyacyl-ACP dehydratase [Candidatus Eisenbacteria bacterium]
MRALGIDIGSRAIKLALLEDGRVLEERRVPTTFDPASQAADLMRGLRWDTIVATGYGRRLLVGPPGLRIITEIKACALGVAAALPAAKTILDIGGQDTKAIAVGDDGRVLRFEMNDRCAAGTGKFLEFMAAGLQVPVEEFGEFALEGRPGATISSMCTVFAETEAISLMAQGRKARDIALALHHSVVKRSLSMLARVGPEPPLAFCGGVALNACVRSLLQAEVGLPLLVPTRPEMMAARGAALAAAALRP